MVTCWLVCARAIGGAAVMVSASNAAAPKNFARVNILLSCLAMAKQYGGNAVDI
jgi:hypothetical protein